MPAVRFSHERAKGDSSLSFRARVPVRVYAAFGPPRDTDQWLDPQPGWDLFRKDAFACDSEDVGTDVFRRDFPAGDTVLFPGQKGNWVLLGIQAR